MKYLFACEFFMMAYFSAIAQIPIQFKCYLKSSCNTDIKLLEEYRLIKGTFNYFSLNEGAIASSLPDTGYYVLKSHHLAVEGDSLIVHIGYGPNVDTIKQDDIIDVVFIDSKPLKGMSQGGGWLCCNKVCKGYNVDYYDNGNKHMEGTFKRGKPVGELKFYDSSGKLKYIEYYNKRGRKLKSRYVNI